MSLDFRPNLFKIVELIVGYTPVRAGIGLNSAVKGILQFAIVGLIIAGSVVAIFEVAPPFPKEGTIRLYYAYAAPQVDTQGAQYMFTQASPSIGGPPDGPSLLSLEVTIDSIRVHSGISDESGWTEISSGTITLDLMKPGGELVLLGSTNISEQNITMVRMHVASAAATLEDTPGTITLEVKVPSGELKIPVNAQIRGQLTTSITITPESVHIVTQTDPIIVTPVLHVDVDGPK